MTVSLGGIVLSDHLILDGLESAPVVASSVRRTLGMRPVVRTLAGSTVGGRELTLSGENHFTLAEVAALRGVAAAGQPVTLVHHRGTFVVTIIRIESEATIRYADPTVDDWYSAVIYLQER